MAKTAYINARVDKNLKAKAEKVLKDVGVNTTDLVEMTLHQVVLQQGVPFPVRRPNKETLRAIRDLRAGKGVRHSGSTEELFNEILGKNWREQNRKHENPRLYRSL
jgi:DNA-damage-inducible protein J